MRAWILILALAALPISTACDDSGTTNPDLAAGGDSCLITVTCVQACMGMAACRQTCLDNASPAALTLFNALSQCALGVCTSAGDAGTPACTGPTDTAAACQMCLGTAGQGAECATPRNACLGA